MLFKGTQESIAVGRFTEKSEIDFRIVNGNWSLRQYQNAIFFV